MKENKYMTDETLRVREGLWLLPVAGFVLVVGLLFRGPFVAFTSNPTGFAFFATGSSALLGWALVLVGVTLTFVGFMALYAHMSRGPGDAWALPGLIAAVIAAMIIMPFVGLMALAGPWIGEAILAGELTAAGALFSTETFVVLAIGGAAYVAASIMFAIGMWRFEGIPNWASVALVVQAPLIAYGAGINLAVELLGAAILVAAGVGIATEVAYEHRAFVEARRKEARPY